MVGNAINLMELSSDWVKLPFANTTYYTMVIDEIKVDWTYGILVERYNAENQIRVAFTGAQCGFWMSMWYWAYGTPSYSPISQMAWGLYSKVVTGIDNDFYGISNLEIIDSACETVNFKGAGIVNLTMNASWLWNNYIGKDCYLDEISMSYYSEIGSNEFINDSYMSNLIIDTSSDIYNNQFDANSTMTYCNLSQDSRIINNEFTSSSIYNNTMSNYSSMTGNFLTGTVIANNFLTITSSISENILENAVINDNNLFSNSSINTNQLYSSNIVSNKLELGGYIIQNILDSSNIIYNTFSNSGMTLNDFQVSTNIQYNNFVVGSRFLSCSFENVEIGYNIINNSEFQLSSSGVLAGCSIIKTQVNNTTVSDNLSSANFIFQSMPKTIFTRKDTIVRLMYYDTTDTPTIVNVNA